MEPLGYFPDGESGKTTTGCTGTEIFDSNKSWVIDEWKGYYVEMITGTAINQKREISSNTATKLVISPAFDPIPSDLDEFFLIDKYNQIPTEIEYIPIQGKIDRYEFRVNEARMYHHNVGGGADPKFRTRGKQDVTATLEYLPMSDYITTHAVKKWTSLLALALADNGEVEISPEGTIIVRDKAKLKSFSIWSKINNPDLTENQILSGCIIDRLEGLYNEDGEFRFRPSIIAGNYNTIISEPSTTLPPMFVGNVPLFDSIGDVTKKIYKWNHTLETGTAESGTVDTLTDSDKSGIWTENQWKDNSVLIKNGTGKGQKRRIISNTIFGVLTIEPVWDVIPDATSEYSIGWELLDPQPILRSASFIINNNSGVRTSIGAGLTTGGSLKAGFFSAGKREITGRFTIEKQDSFFLDKYLKKPNLPTGDELFKLEFESEKTGGYFKVVFIDCFQTGTFDKRTRSEGESKFEDIDWQSGSMEAYVKKQV